MDRADIIASCKKIFSERGDIEEILRVLRDNEFTKVQSINVLVELGIGSGSLNQAKQLVHHSYTWKDVRESDEKFHDAIHDAQSKADNDNKTK